MIRGYSAEAIRSAEQPLLQAGEPLMQRASRALADRILVRLSDSAASGVVVLAGGGANGGDGLHAAALLLRCGIRAQVIATADRLHDGGAAAYAEAGGTAHPLDQLSERELAALVAGADLVIDAIVGIGGRSQIPAELTALLQTVRESDVPVIAVDLPSFLDATTGEAPDAALPALETVTFGALKAGLLLPGGAELTGQLHLADLGLEEQLADHEPAVVRLQDSDVRTLWPRPSRDVTKYSRGVVAIAAGSSAFPGAAVLTTSGAARTGAGMVRCLAPAPVLDLVLRLRPEVVGHRAPDTDTDTPVPDPIDLEEIGRTRALVVGPGLAPDDPRARRGVELLLARTGELDRGVIDAGGLDALTAHDRFGADVVLTPHGGEAARLARRLNIDPEQSVAELSAALAARLGATVLHKGAVTVIAPGDAGPLRAQDDATPQLATAGTGDVLAGVIGALLAAGLPGPDAAALGALLHGRAGRSASQHGVVPLVALDVADHLPRALAAILAGATP